MAQPRLPACARRALFVRRQFCSRVCLLDVGQHLRELLDEPGMQDDMRSRQDTFGAQDTSGWTKEGEQFRGASSLVRNAGCKTGCPSGCQEAPGCGMA